MPSSEQTDWQIFKNVLKTAASFVVFGFERQDVEFTFRLVETLYPDATNAERLEIICQALACFKDERQRDV